MSDDRYNKPFDLPGELVDSRVEVTRTDGSGVIGTLEAFDRHINMVLTDATVYPDGTDAQQQEDVDRFFQRGGAVTDIRPADGDDQ